MAHEDTIYALMESLVIADKHVIGDLMAHKGIWTRGASAVNNSYKALNLLADSGKLVKGDGFFKLPECQSEYKEHAQLLTKAIARILKLNLTSKIYREFTLKEIGLRPDAIVMLTKENQGLMFVLEVCNNEFPEFLTSKIHALRGWFGALQIFSLLFRVKVNAFDIVVSGDIEAEGTFEFNDYLKEVEK